jgi:hypothetical protein
MAFLPDQCCHACRARALAGTDHCAQDPSKAETSREYDRNRNRTESRRFYDTAAWAECSRNIRTYNPVCQRILEDGRQCKNPPAAVHHLEDPKDAPNLKLAWSNLVAVCTEHHAGGQRGETQGEKYVHTIGPLNAVFKHDGLARVEETTNCSRNIDTGNDGHIPIAMRRQNIIYR